MLQVRSRLVLAVVFLLSCLPLAAQQPAVTLEGVLSAPFPSELLASPTGGKLAWVQNSKGIRNLWVAEPPEYRGRQVTRYTADDGQSLGGLEWTPDAKTLIYVRGGGANRQGDIPNPTSDPAGAEQGVWRVSLDGGEPVRISPGRGAVVSPRGDGVTFLKGPGVFWAPFEGKGEPVQWVKVRGGASQLRFSPDGSKLAFTSNRGDHSFIGVYDVAAKTLRWMAPSVDGDSNPVWSPDGTRLAFLREPASSKVTLFHPNPSAAQPWSILVADVATGEAKTAWRAEPGPGSAFHGMVAANQLLWAAEDRLIFPWERDGWLHLYSVPASGGKATLLTPGEFEVEFVNLSPDRRQVVFNSNQDDINRRHVWRVDVTGGRPAALTKGTGIEWLPVMTSDGKALAYFRSGARRPAQAVIEVNGTSRELAPGTVPPEFPESALVEPEPVIFSAADGLRIHGQLFLPPGIKKGERRPGILFFHGGSHRQMLLGWHYSGYYNNAYALNQYLASRGYVVLSVNFRAGTGYGLAFREAPNQGAAGASEFNDVLGAGLYLRNRSDVDPDRIGLWGGSYGGYLTALGLARASNLFAAGVDIHGVHDWNVGIRNFNPSYDPKPDEERLAFESSPMAWLDGWRSPVLVIHGDDDRNVAFSETVDLVEALRERKVEVEQLILPDEVHSFLRYASWLAVHKATADFFDRRLKGPHLPGPPLPTPPSPRTPVWTWEIMDRCSETWWTLSGMLPR